MGGHVCTRRQGGRVCAQLGENASERTEPTTSARNVGAELQCGSRREKRSRSPAALVQAAKTEESLVKYESQFKAAKEPERALFKGTDGLNLKSEYAANQFKGKVNLKYTSKCLEENVDCIESTSQSSFVSSLRGVGLQTNYGSLSMEKDNLHINHVSMQVEENLQIDCASLQFDNSSQVVYLSKPGGDSPQLEYAFSPIDDNLQVDFTVSNDNLQDDYIPSQIYGTLQIDSDLTFGNVQTDCAPLLMEKNADFAQLIIDENPHMGGLSLSPNDNVLRLDQENVKSKCIKFMPYLQNTASLKSTELDIIKQDALQCEDLEHGKSSNTGFINSSKKMRKKKNNMGNFPFDMVTQDKQISKSVWQNEQILNLSTHQLNKEEIEVLQKGLNFCPTCNMDYFNTYVDFQKFIRKIALKRYFKVKELQSSVQLNTSMIQTEEIVMDVILDNDKGVNKVQDSFSK
eukprot:XP_004914941.1 PREDICTED: uncharacterized protein LOC101732358 [Xenopus tropicalis]